MKNRLVCQAEKMKHDLMKAGCGFISQKSDSVTHGIVLRFSRNGQSEIFITRIIEGIIRTYRSQIGLKEFEVYLYNN